MNKVRWNFNSLDDEQVERIESDSESDNRACGKAEWYVEILGILKWMEYLIKVQTFMLHESYTEVLSDIKDV